MARPLRVAVAAAVALLAAEGIRAGRPKLLHNINGSGPCVGQQIGFVKVNLSLIGKLNVSGADIIGVDDAGGVVRSLASIAEGSASNASEVLNVSDADIIGVDNAGGVVRQPDCGDQDLWQCESRYMLHEDVHFQCGRRKGMCRAYRQCNAQPLQFMIDAGCDYTTQGVYTPGKCCPAGYHMIRDEEHCKQAAEMLGTHDGGFLLHSTEQPAFMGVGGGDSLSPPPGCLLQGRPGPAGRRPGQEKVQRKNKMIYEVFFSAVPEGSGPWGVSRPAHPKTEAAVICTSMRIMPIAKNVSASASVAVVNATPPRHHSDLQRALAPLKSHVVATKRLRTQQ